MRARTESSSKAGRRNLLEEHEMRVSRPPLRAGHGDGLLGSSCEEERLRSASERSSCSNGACGSSKWSPRLRPRAQRGVAGDVRGATSFGRERFSGGCANAPEKGEAPRAQESAGRGADSPLLNRRPRYDRPRGDRPRLTTSWPTRSQGRLRMSGRFDHRSSQDSGGVRVRRPSASTPEEFGCGIGIPAFCGTKRRV